MDVACGSNRDNSVIWYENAKGDSLTWTAHVQSTVHSTLSVFAADVDGDGDTDLLASTSNTDDVLWYQNNGVPLFIEHWIGGVDSGYRIHAADVDGDGDVDPLVADFADNQISWFENECGTPEPTFTPRPTTSPQPTPVPSYDTPAPTGTPSYATAAPTLTPVPTVPAPTPRPSATCDIMAWSARQPFAGTDDSKNVFPVDLDQDGDTDVVVAADNRDTLAWHENADGSGAFTTEHVVTSTRDGLFYASPLDVDGDDDVDIFACSYRDSIVSWWENDGSANFAEHVLNTYGGGALSVIGADVDGDNDVDAVVANEGDNDVEWFENQGSQNYRVRYVSNYVNTPREAAPVDMDGDQDVARGVLVERRARASSGAWSGLHQADGDRRRATSSDARARSARAGLTRGRAASKRERERARAGRRPRSVTGAFPLAHRYRRRWTCSSRRSRATASFGSRTTVRKTLPSTRSGRAPTDPRTSRQPTSTATETWTAYPRRRMTTKWPTTKTTGR